MTKALNDQEFKSIIDNTDKKTDYKRLQGVYLFQYKNKSAKEAAEAVGTTEAVINQWVYKYKLNGINALIGKPRGGRRRAYMTYEEEAALLNELSKDAQNGLIVISKAIQLKAEEKLGKPVSHDYATDLLNRHNWRKIVPRPKHPKSSKEEQDEFKKNFRVWQKIR